MLPLGFITLGRAGKPDLPKGRGMLIQGCFPQLPVLYSEGQGWAKVSDKVPRWEGFSPALVPSKM